MAVRPAPAGELPSLPGGDFVHDLGRHSEPRQEILVDDAHSAAGDRADGELLLAGHSELANDKDVERSPEGAGDLESDGNSTARQAEHDDVWAACIVPELSRQPAARLRAVPEDHLDSLSWLL